MSPEATYNAGSEHVSQETGRRRGMVLAWASWDWGSASFNAVMTTFVFTVYLTSKAFGGEDHASGVLGLGFGLAGFAIALLAPVTGQRADAGGRRKLWLGLYSAVVVILMALCFFVRPEPEYLLLGVILISVGHVFFELAGVNYNAMLTQISTPSTIGRVSGFGWAAGYLGGIVALLLVLQLFVQPAFHWFGASTDDALNIRLVALFSAVWFGVFALPVFFRVPEPPVKPGEARVGFLQSYVVLVRRIRALFRRSPHTIYFLLASAVFRDGLAAVFTFGGVIAAGTFGFQLKDVIFFAVYLRAPQIKDGETAEMPGMGVSQNGAPYAAIAMATAHITNRWGVYYAAAKAPATYARGQAKIGLQLAADKQVIDLGPVFALDLGPDYDINSLPHN